MNLGNSNPLKEVTLSNAAIKTGRMIKLAKHNKKGARNKYDSLSRQHSCKKSLIRRMKSEEADLVSVGGILTILIICTGSMVYSFLYGLS
jgi:hypothetical protein